MGDIKPIETRYKGYRFRSRLEARWAVYFDTLGIQYEYEKEGFDLDEVGRYLPDFWLPQVKMWAEVKAEKLNKSEMIKAEALAKTTGFGLLMLVGTPDTIPYWIIEQETCDNPDNCSECFCPICENLVEYDCVIDTSYLDENRFYAYLGDNSDAVNDETRRASQAARSARFEYGERG